MPSMSSNSPRPFHYGHSLLLSTAESKVKGSSGKMAWLWLHPFTSRILLWVLLCCLLYCSVCLLLLVVLFVPFDLEVWRYLKTPYNSEKPETSSFSSSSNLSQFSGWDLLNATMLHRRPNCARVFANDKDYIAEIAKQRITFEDPNQLEMNCAEIRRRSYFADKEQHPEDADFSLAQARVVFRDYVMLEKELAASYSPHNWYCYSMDRKSTTLFRWRMRELAKCLPNVLVSEQEYPTDSSGRNINRAHMDCLKMLVTPGKRWEYVALLQNHDVSIKTNREAVQIYRWMDGANDVEVTSSVPGRRVNMALDWSFEAIHLFRNETRNIVDTPNGFEPKLVFSKGYSESSLSRKMAEFIIHELDLGETLRRLEAGYFGMDEILIPTLHASDALQAPGGFTRACMDRNIPITHISRATIWGHKGCGSQRIRHTICLYGLEDLPTHLAVFPHLFANKLMPEFDFGAMLCWWEEMHRKAHNQTREHSLAKLDKNYYKQLPHVRFQKLLRDLANSTSGLNMQQIADRYRQATDHFNCTFDPKSSNYPMP